MGVLATLLASSKTISDGDSADSTVVRFLKSAKFDPIIPTDKAARNAVVTITANAQVAGNFKLVITVGLNAPVTTANIAFNANAATIEGAIDTACAGIPGWTNSDISVACATTANLANVILTFDGASVAATRCTVVAGTADFSPTITETTAGQTDRPAIGALKALGIVDIATKQYATPVLGDFTFPTNTTTNPDYPPPAVVQALLEEASIEDRTNYVAWFKHALGRGPTP